MARAELNLNFECHKTNLYRTYSDVRTRVLRNDQTQRRKCENGNVNELVNYTYMYKLINYGTCILLNFTYISIDKIVIYLIII